MVLQLETEMERLLDPRFAGSLVMMKDVSLDQMWELRLVQR